MLLLAQGQAEVAKLIAGPKVYIFDECVDLCHDLLEEETARAEAPAVEVRPVVPAGLYCALCRLPAEGGFVIVPDRGPLCAACLDAIRSVTEDDASGPEAQP